MISPNALGTKNSPTSAPLATTRHLRMAETASAIKESRIIHAADPATIAQAINRFDHSQPKPLIDAWNRKISRPGTHVISDSRNATTAILPRTYSVRDSGRQRYRGSALLARSRDISGGATITVRINAKPPCTSRNVLKNVLS